MTSKNNTPLLVAIDGPAGVGKSTLARRLAAKLGIACLDTGAMFRTVALHIGESGLTLPADELLSALHSLTFSLAGSGSATRLACNGKHAGQEIRTEKIGMLASQFAAIPAVRAYLKNAQQRLGENFSLVAEGRDMGSEIFPQATVKFFLDASAEVRARRRRDQLASAGISQDIAELAEQIRQRDARDRNRDVAPLRPADDAIIIDTSRLNIEEALALMLAACSAL